MRKSEPQPRSRKTPTGGKRMAKLLEQGQKWVWNRGRDSNVQNLAKGIVSTMCTRWKWETYLADVRSSEGHGGQWVSWVRGIEPDAGGL